MLTVTCIRVTRPDGLHADDCRRLREKRLARVRKAIGAKVYDAQLADYYARLDVARGL